MPFLILLILFIVVPIAEITLLIRVGSAIGILNTLGFVIFTAILGAYLVRQQGFATITKFQQESQEGRVPAMPMAEGIALLFAGAVLLTPGFITDALGFSLLIPPLRRGIIAWAAKHLIANANVHYSYTAQGTNRASHTSSRSTSTVIEGEVTSSSKEPE